VTLV
jgi:ribonuclease HI